MTETWCYEHFLCLIASSRWIALCIPNCKSLWIKASAKWLNVNVNLTKHFTIENHTTSAEEQKQKLLSTNCAWMWMNSNWECYRWPRASLGQLRLCRGQYTPQTHCGFAPACRLNTHRHTTSSVQTPLHKHWSNQHMQCVLSVCTRRAVVKVKVSTEHIKHHHLIFSSGHRLELIDPFDQQVQLLEANRSVAWSANMQNK